MYFLSIIIMMYLSDVIVSTFNIYISIYKCTYIVYTHCDEDER